MSRAREALALSSLLSVEFALSVVKVKHETI